MRHSNREQQEPEAPGSKSKPGWRPILRQEVRPSRTGRVRSCQFQLSLWHSPVWCCSFLSELGNERTVCASPYCSSAELNAAHAPISGDRKPFVGHRPVFLLDAGAPAHKVANAFVATPRGHQLLST